MYHPIQFKSHLVLSAFTLNELPNFKSRLDTLLTLWNKCDGYIVLIENGTNAGFKLIEEARDFLLQQAQRENSAYLFAPVSKMLLIKTYHFHWFLDFCSTQCPHQTACPRMLKNDGTPCNFFVTYRSLDIGQSKRDNKILFSYVIFKKGPRDDDRTIDWPRLIRPTQVRTRHTRCKMCTHRGKLEEVVVTKAKHTK